MTSRTTYTTITFAHPFCLSGFDAPQPAGSYTVRTEEELLEGLSFAAYGRIGTEISIPVDHAGPGSIQVVTTDPQELERALEADRAKILETRDRPATLASPDVDAAKVSATSSLWRRPWNLFRFGRSST
ncbi:MAG: hypothetical protein JWQ36_1566 [Enterovirga sp.]|jgi:hypothetical protein|nr:hypothetical protein [Enterovirga sp.]